MPDTPKPKKNPILLQWQQPQIINQTAGKKIMQGCWLKLVRVTLIAVLFLTLAHFAMSELPIEQPITIKTIALLIFFTLFIGSYSIVIGPYLFIRTKTTCILKEKTIHFSCSQGSSLYFWKNILDYTYCDSPDFSGLKKITFSLKHRERSLYFSDKETFHQALAIFAAKVERKAVPPRITVSFSKLEWLYIVVFLLFCSFLIVYYFFDIKEFLQPVEDFAPLIFLVLFFAPGALAVLMLKGFKGLMSQQGFRWVSILGIFFLHFCIAIGLCCAYCQTYKLFH